MTSTPVTIGLSAVVMAMTGDELGVLTVQPEGHAEPALPSGPFDPDAHRTFELGLRDFVTAQTGLTLGYVEQLYTFGDAGRAAPRARLDHDRHERIVSVGYLALAPVAGDATIAGARWRPWTHFFPYEDWRNGPAPVIQATIAPALAEWASGSATRQARADSLFALSPGSRWREDRVLERYELLYEAGLTHEACRDRGQPASPDLAFTGQPMESDHRRILATGLGRLRGKLRYRPVVFDLMAPAFTLLVLQKTVEAIIGQRLHKQNFRRAVERAELVERTGRIDPVTGGRPAELFRTRPVSPGDAQSLGLTLPVLR